MLENELYYRLALSLVPGIGPIRYKKLISYFESAENIFKQHKKSLKKTDGMHESLAEAIRNFIDFDAVEKELKYCEKNDISILCFDDEAYPQKLKICVDSPSILFQKGNVNLNHTRMLSVIGTRSITEYGKKICEELIEHLKPYNVIIASGLAYGADVLAHKTCLKYDIPTVGVVAHGLDMIYPIAHKNISKEMTEQGALLSEYFSDAKLEKGNFPARNRIVAGMSDATIVIETDLKGGSMITADIAFSYNREVFCFPGKTTDSKSAGCNFLIKKMKAQLITCAEDIAYEMGWKETQKQKPIQKELFIEMTNDEQIIMKTLRENGNTHIDQLMHFTNLNSSQIAVAMLNLEMQNIIKVMPGKVACIA